MMLQEFPENARAKTIGFAGGEMCVHAAQAYTCRTCSILANVHDLDGNRRNL